MVDIQITCTGLDAVIADISVMNTKVLERVKEKIQESAERLKVGAEQRAPVASKTYSRGEGQEYAPGFLKEHIKITYKPIQFIAIVSYLGKAWYGKFVEFGTVDQAAQPFLGPAWQEEKPNFIKGVHEAVTEETEKGL